MSATRGNSQRAMLLEGRILPCLLLTAAPTTVSMVVPVLSTLGQLYFLAQLGKEAVAGVTLALPMVTLLQMISSGDIGGAVSGAVARSLGAGKHVDANDLPLHCLVLSLIFGFICATLQFSLAPISYPILGGTGRVLGAAISYSNVIFFGSVVVWITNLLSSIVRGAGEVGLAARVLIVSRCVTFPFCPLFIFGWGPIPAMGAAGAGVADILFYIVTSTWFIFLLLRADATVRLIPDLSRIRPALLIEPLVVGGVLAARTLQTFATSLLLVASIGAMGADAIAGYGIASSLESMIVPLLFGFGTAILIMVGTNLGAQQVGRAYRTAVIGVAFAASVLGAIGVGLSIFPGLWLRLFSQDPQVLALGSQYLAIVGPFYGCFVIGAMMYFVGQAASLVRWNFLAASARLLTVFVGCYISKRVGTSVVSISLTVAVSYVVFGMVNLLTLTPRIGLSVNGSSGPA